MPSRENGQGRTAEPVMTAPLDRDELEAISEEIFNATPTLVQARINKKREWRVVVVGGAIFPYVIDPGAKAYTRLDWRRGGAVARFDAAPEAVHRFSTLNRFVRAAGLDYGVFDFIEGPDARLWFLECNPDGQWLFLDQTGTLTESFAKFFCSRGCAQ